MRPLNVIAMRPLTFSSYPARPHNFTNKTRFSPYEILAPKYTIVLLTQTSIVKHNSDRS